MNSTTKLIRTLQVFTKTAHHIRLANKEHHSFVKESWAKFILNHLNVEPIIFGKSDMPDGPMILLGNHISYLDIPLILSCYPEISFVSKKEVKSWPVIGKAAVKANTLFVDRGNSKNRNDVKNELASLLICHKNKIVLFPSGTTTIKKSERWKKGIFEIAAQNQIPVLPFRICYSPMREAAYIDDDHFFCHLYKLFNHKKIKARVEFHTPVYIQDPIKDCEYWKNWCEDF